MTTQSCPKCGMEQSTWPDKNGFKKEQRTYCCRGCAEGTGCTCASAAGRSTPASRELTPAK